MIYRASPRMAYLYAEIPPVVRSRPHILCGSAILAALGLREVEDLDVLVTPHGLMDLVNHGAKRYEDHEYGRAVWRLDTPSGKIDFFDTLPRLGWGLDRVEAGDHVRRAVGNTGGMHGVQILSGQVVAAIKCLVPADHPKARRHAQDAIQLLALGGDL